MNGVLTFFHGLIGKDDQVELGAIAETATQDDLALQLKDGDEGAIELNARRLLLRLELEKDRGRHVDGLVGALRRQDRKSQGNGSGICILEAYCEAGDADAYFAQ